MTDAIAVKGLRALPYYLGGFLGPFGTTIIVPMLPELREHFDVDSSAISWGFSAYLFPMAAFLLVSGTIGERFGRRKVLRISVASYVGASILVSMAPTLGLFLAARAIQGVGNAFITPLLIAGLADVTPEAQLGRRLGLYSSFQAAGGGMAPFAGGLAAALDWRLAFWGTAAVATIILAFPPPGERRVGGDRPPIRPLVSKRLVILGLGALAAAAGPIGAGILIGLKSRDVLGMDPTTAGLLLASGNFGAMLLGPLFGRLIDRYGARVCGIGATMTISLLIAAQSTTDTVASTAVLFCATGSLFGFLVAVLQKVGASIVPENRGGALSAVLAFRFIGHAIGPLLWVPVFSRSVSAAFLGSAALGVLTIAAIAMAVPGHTRSGTPAVAAGALGGVASTKNNMPAPASSARIVKPKR
ncbi:MAG: MFS transporter [Acidimicrobiales bacterium]